MTRLCMILIALAVIARTRVAVLPGWTVPLPVLITVTVLILCGAMLAWLVLRTPRGWTPAASGWEAVP